MSELALQLIAKEKIERTGKLDLGNCGLTDFPEELFELDWLEELSFNDLKWDSGKDDFIIANPGHPNYFSCKKLPRSFCCFNQLKKLELEGTFSSKRHAIEDFSVLADLTTLEDLSLGYNQIQDISFLEKLTCLDKLYLSSNQISDISILSKLNVLTCLFLGENPIADISVLTQLTGLNSLYIGTSQITDFSILSQLSNLTFLFLSSNQINDISFLEKLTELQDLKLWNFPISDISIIGNLRRLNSLTLRNNQISDISILKNLKDLTRLDLSSNQISDISILGNLTGLTRLDLGNNQISDLRSLEKLTGLSNLSLNGNKISDISVLGNLTCLTGLGLYGNQISDISVLSNLTCLTSLDLSFNKINNIQALMPHIKRGLSVNLEIYLGQGISLYKNPITTPPMSIVEEGTEAILTYFEQLKKGSEKLYEARIVIVGESKAGKTTLFKKLNDENTLVPDPNQESTHGININQERTFTHTNGVQIKSSIWDFGGQDTQNYLHQYFYAKDNLFVLVCDQRAEKTRFDYWFEMITRLCSESRIIVVRNLNERVTASQSLNLKEYEARFPGIRVCSVDVDFKINDARWTLLIQTIEENLSMMERVNQPIPRTWKPIREAIQLLKEESEYRISFEEFQNICSTNGLPEEDYQNQCLDYLHWLGYALHYSDPSLTNTIFINPEWITTGLYEILREENYKPELKGRFSQTDIHSIWKGKEYTPTDRNHLLNLLLKDSFEVCYKVEGSDNYLVPILISNEQKEPSKPESKPYTLRFKFPFIPFGFFSRLIVRLYDKIWDDYVWLTGVWLKDKNNCLARMEHFKDVNTGEEVFEISIYGEKKERKALLSEIRNEIFHIRKILFPNLIIEEQIPCSCDLCSRIKTPYFHSRSALEKMAAQNQFDSQCKESGKLISTGQLLDSIIDTEQLKRQYKDMVKEGINIEINQKNKQVQKNKQKVNVKNEVNIAINNIIGEVRNLKEDFEDEKKLLLRKGIDKDDYGVALKDIGKAEKALAELESAQKQNQALPEASKNRLKRFVDDLSDEKSTLHKGLKLLRKGRDYGVNLAELYNKIAANTGMPLVPPLALEVIKKL